MYAMVHCYSACSCILLFTIAMLVYAHNVGCCSAWSCILVFIVAVLAMFIHTACHCYSACSRMPPFIVAVLVHAYHCSLLQLRPLFGDQGYLDDQHILIAVKGANDDQESFGEPRFPSFNLV